MSGEGLHRTRHFEGRRAAILVDECNGDRLVMWGRDAALSLSKTEITADAMASARLVHVDDVDADAAVRSAHLARAAGVPVTSDLDRVNDRTPELVRAVSVPVFASHVPEALTGERNLVRAQREGAALQVKEQQRQRRGDHEQGGENGREYFAEGAHGRPFIPRARSMELWDA